MACCFNTGIRARPVSTTDLLGTTLEQVSRRRELAGSFEAGGSLHGVGSLGADARGQVVSRPFGVLSKAVHGHFLHHRVDVQNRFGIELVLFISGALIKVVLERTADKLLLLLEIGFNLSLELVDGREATDSGSGGAFRRVGVLVGLFVLNNLFPVGARQEHEVKLVLILTAVVRQLV